MLLSTVYDFFIRLIIIIPGSMFRFFKRYRLRRERNSGFFSFIISYRFTIKVVFLKTIKGSNLSLKILILGNAIFERVPIGFTVKTMVSIEVRSCENCSKYNWNLRVPFNFLKFPVINKSKVRCCAITESSSILSLVVMIVSFMKSLMTSSPIPI